MHLGRHGHKDLGLRRGPLINEPHIGWITIRTGQFIQDTPPSKNIGYVTLYSTYRF